MSKAGDWQRLKARWRERLAHVTPDVLTLYPFEVLATTVGLLMGGPVLLGLARPESIVYLLPAAAYYSWSAALVIGAAIVAAGLKKTRPLVLASGLQLLGGNFCVYAVAVVKVAGWEHAWVAFTAFIVLWILSWARSFHWRRIVDIQLGAQRAARR